MVSNLIPDPLDNDLAYARFYHFDIDTLEPTDILDELYALRPLLWGLPESHWLRERVRLLEADLVKRKYDTRS